MQHIVPTHSISTHKRPSHRARLHTSALVTAATCAALGAVSSARADMIAWAQWPETGQISTSATGAITSLAQPLDVTTVSAGTSVVIAGGQVDFGPPGDHVGGIVDNAPCSAVIEGVCRGSAVGVFSTAGGGSRTILFSSPVENPVLAVRAFASDLVLTFSDATLPVVQRSGSTAGGSFVASGSRILVDLLSQGSFVVPGIFSVIAFTEQVSSGPRVSSSDYVLNVGVPVPVRAVPEPDTLGLMAAGFAALAGLARRRGRTRAGSGANFRHH